MNKLDNAKDARATDALLNYETVKYFSNDELERRQFEKAITDYQTVEFKALASLNILNVIQSSVIFCGVISGLVVCTNVRPLNPIPTPPIRPSGRLLAGPKAYKEDLVSSMQICRRKLSK